MGTYRTVKFTGERTGLERIRVPGFGVIEQGDELLIDAERAEAWAAELPTAELHLVEDDDGADVETQVLKADFELVGDEEELDKREYQERREELREKFMASHDDSTDERSLEDLREAAEKVGLATSGTKAQIRKRLADKEGSGETVEEFAASLQPQIEANEAGGDAGNAADAGDGLGGV